MYCVVKTWEKLCGRTFCNNVFKNLLEECNELRSIIPDFKSSLAFFELLGTETLGFDNLIHSINSCGIYVQHVAFPGVHSKAELLNMIQRYNQDFSIHGIYVCQNPLKPTFKDEILESIIPCKDVGGITFRAFSHQKLNVCVSTIGQACLELLKTTDKILSQSNVTVIGENETTVKIANLFLLNNATVTIVSPRKVSLKDATQAADIIIIMCEESEMCSKIHLKKGAVILGLKSTDSKTNILHNVDGDHENSPAYVAYLPDLILTSIALAVKNTFMAAKTFYIPPDDSKWDLTPNPLTIKFPILSDIEISRSQQPKNIEILAKEIGLLPHEFEVYGKYKAKVSLDVVKRLKYSKQGKYIVVSGMTPTPFGEGKSTTTIGLCQALGAHLNRNVFACVRQPSQGPTFGIKGGAAGGGYSQVIPMEDFNLHLTGDIHAVTAANNLLAAQIDARMFHEATQSNDALYKRLVPGKDENRKFSKIQLARLKKLGISKTDPSKLSEEEIHSFVRLDIDPTTISFQRVMDTNDRFLRKIKIGLSASEKGYERDAQFNIAVASEVMAILALSADLSDLKNRLSKIVVARDRKGNAVTADDLGVTGAMAALLKDAIMPNLMQTLEGTPVFVHAGPFANIAHGNSSIIADKMALKMVGQDGFVVTEAGFGADIGLEKFFHIKCRYSGLVPDAVIIVATIRALKMHGGKTLDSLPQSLLTQEELKKELLYLEKGFCNLAKHIENVKTFGVPVIVGINHFGGDTEEELECVKKLSLSQNTEACVVCSHFCKGGEGAKELAECVIKTTQLTRHNDFHYLYDLKDSIESKINKVAVEIYGAKEIILAPEAKDMIEIFEREGLNNLPICMAKTQYSLSHDPTLKGAPKDFQLPIRDIRASVGAGFLYPLVGGLMLMPGLPTRPCFYDIDINEETMEIEGLF